MYRILKRNGQTVDFDITKISDAVRKAFEATETEYTKSVIELISLRATAGFADKVKDGLVSVEDIQDAVETALIQAGYDKVAKAYILYRKQHEKTRNLPTTLLDYRNLVDSYVKAIDWRVKENSTVTYSVGGLILSNSGAVTANYWLSEVYDEEIANAHRNADIHIHDLSMLTGYCFTGDTRIKTLDGKNPTFKELVDKNVKTVKVFAYDTENKKVVIADAVNPRITRRAKDLIKITLSTKKEIVCTPDHLFMMRDGTYKKAEDLRSNDSLMALYIGEKGKYCSINKAWNSQKIKTYLHRWIAENYVLKRPLLENEVVHHIDGNKHNNCPENLMVMNSSDHRSSEIRKTMNKENWILKNHERVSLFNKSEEKRLSVSLFAKARARQNGRFVTEFSYQPDMDAGKVSYNHTIRKVEHVTLDKPVDLYDLTVPGYENFSLDANVFVHNCAGWSLRQLITEGLGGVNGKITSSPANHLSTLCNQMVNFLGIMQNEWAGAQAFSSFDTYLAPFVKVDNLSYKEVKQNIQSFIYGVNTPSRWGCVTKDTEVLSVDGFKKYNELKKGDLIYTWNDGKLELNAVREVVSKPYKGKMHEYCANGYNQTVTPTHRMLIKKHNLDEYEIKHSEDIFDAETPYAFPVAFKGNSLVSSPLTDEEIMFAAMIYTDGSICLRNGNVHKVELFKSPKRYGNDVIVKCCEKLGLKYSLTEKESGFGNGNTVNQYTFYGDNARRIVNLVGDKKSVDEKFMKMDGRQSMLFIETWSKFDGIEEKFMLQFDNDTIADQLQHIALRAGLCSYRHETEKANYIKIRKTENIYPASRKEVEYDDIVWCPNVENGTAVFRKDGKVFISGQTQAPFTNVTLDWTVPEDMAEQYCVVGGKTMDFQYKDCKKEMDMINKAFIEVMIEGDANGRGFQYPIPTYSITKDFDWSENENNKLLFEMTAKYGTPYFSNYVNSDMKPSDIRSMCPMTSDTKVFVRSKQNGVRLASIGDIYRTYKNHQTEFEVWTEEGWKPGKPVATEKTDVLEIKLSNGSSVKLGVNHLQPTKDNGTLHADELKVGTKLPFSKKTMNSEFGTSELGFAVGAYAGDGSRDENAIVYSLDAGEKDNETEKRLVSFWNSFGFRTTVSYGDGNVRFLRVNGYPYSVVSFYVDGTSALNKQFTNNVFRMSEEFRNGLIEGFRATDGSRDKNRLYTSSEFLREGLCNVLASLGRKYSCNYVDTRDGRLGSDPNYRIDYPERENYGELFCEDEKNIYYTITEIKNYQYSGEQLYCFEVDNNDHLFVLANGLVTHNCRLRLDLTELRRKNGGFFGSGESTGSVGVVTINMPRLAYLASDKEDFYGRLDHIMDISARSLHIKRKLITNLMENGLYPYTKRYLGTFDNHFSTIGLVGMNEAGLNAKWLRKDLTEPECQEFVKECLNHMRSRLIQYQEKYHALFNLEATPAESTSFRLAKHDKEKYPDIITASKEGETPYYTNSSHLPVGFTQDIFEALDIQDELQTLYTSGTVFHAFLGEKLPDWKSAANLVKKISDNYKLPYYTMSPTYSICPEHGYLSGEQYTCPHCGKKTEVWSRITGYYRPIQNWNDGKTQEFKERKEYVPQMSVPKERKPDACTEVKAEVKKIQTGESVPVMYVQDHCPKCKGAEQRMTLSGIEFKTVNCTTNKEVIDTMNLEETPTIIDPDGTRYVGANAAVDWIRDHKK